MGAPECGPCDAAGHEQRGQGEPEPEGWQEPEFSRRRPEKSRHGPFYRLPIQLLVPRLFRKSLLRPLARRQVRGAGSAGSQMQVEILALRSRQGAVQGHVQGRFWMRAGIHRSTPRLSGE